MARKFFPKRTGTPADLLVIGLGNPGSQYEHTRHNVGQDTVELLARRHNVTLKRAMGVALWGHTRIGAANDKLLALGLPGTYMNLSGEGTSTLVRRYGVEDLNRLVIIHDELDLEPGRIQIKVGGGLAGHNGLKSIKHHLKDDGFVRIRIGIGRPTNAMPASDYVLKKPMKDEAPEILLAIERAADAAEMIATQGITSAMNSYN